MKILPSSLTSLLLLLTACLTGCCWNPYPPYSPQGGRPCWYMAGQSIINNSGCDLDVVQDGILICKKLRTGQVLPLRPGLFQPSTSISVAGYDSFDNYLGCAEHIFVYSVPEIWRVGKLTPISQ